MAIKIGDKVFIKKNFWSIPSFLDVNVPEEMQPTEGTFGIVTDVALHNIELEDVWWYAREWLVPLDSMDNDKLFELYVQGYITSSEYNTLSKVKEGE